MINTDIYITSECYLSFKIIQYHSHPKYNLVLLLNFIIIYALFKISGHFIIPISFTTSSISNSQYSSKHHLIPLLSFSIKHFLSYYYKHKQTIMNFSPKRKLIPESQTLHKL